MWIKKSIRYILAMAVVGIVGISPLFDATIAYALPSWTQIQSTNNWNTASLSGNGQYGLVGADSGRLYLISNNNTVSEVMPGGAVDYSWTSTAINKTGSHMLAADAAFLYINRNGGVGSWSQIQPDINAASPWRALAINNAGNKIVTGNEYGRLWVSNNGGVSWTETRPLGDTDQSWWTASVSSNCDTILAGTYGKRLYLSKNGGDTWVETQPAGDQDVDWRVNDVKGNGQIMFVAARFGRAYISTNGGDTWTETRPKGNADEAWMRGQISDDGQTAIISADSGRVYVTTNGGDTWTETQPSGDNNRFWYAIAMNGDGSKMLAGASQNNLYVSGIVGDGTEPLATADSDGDGKNDSTENSGPNSGDANDDGTADSIQANIASYVNPVSGQRVVLEVPQSCTLDEVASIAESTNTHADAGYEYPAGMLNFSAVTNTPGGTATIKQYYYGLTDNPNYVVRKYNPNTGLYSTILGATRQQATVGGQAVLVVTYSVVDGGPLDADGTANGVIVDPAGIALAATTSGNSGSLQETGAEVWPMQLLGLSILALSLITARLSAKPIRE